MISVLLGPGVTGWLELGNITKLLGNFTAEEMYSYLENFLGETARAIWESYKLNCPTDFQQDLSLGVNPYNFTNTATTSTAQTSTSHIRSYPIGQPPRESYSSYTQYNEDREERWSRGNMRTYNVSGTNFSSRMVIDYRRLNDNLEDDSYDIPDKTELSSVSDIYSST